MTDNKLLKPDYLFEVSWEICNKVGGIHTVVSTKAPTLVKEFGDNYILIGPDVWKETSENPEFVEDKFLFKSWKERAEQDGLFFHIGRWKIQGSPIVILVDFTPYFNVKDKIFADFWVKYNLDSITGGWDYVEPALFGYAAARVIENFYKFNLSAQDRIIAQFHEWMTGTGILYLKDNVPQAGCIFTTHATVIGRSIAGNMMPLYRDLKSYHADSIASNLGVRAKYSLEKIAAKQADSFTTVSQLTASECLQFLEKEVDILTPNGFDNSFVPAEDKFAGQRQLARERIFTVAEALLNQRLNRDSLLVLNSGRYEFRNKGIDLFIDSMWKLNTDKDLKQEIIAFIGVPAHHTGPSPDLVERMLNPDFSKPAIDTFVTHDIFDPETDPILNRIKRTGLRNEAADKVKIIFVPAYMNGNDGVFNLSYYDLLIGFDLSAFPSYYEPWGYTPLESLAFKIPAITTSLTGFGRWMQSNAGDLDSALQVIERTEDNSVYVVDQIADSIRKFILLTVDEVNKVRTNSMALSQVALWEKLIIHYYEAYSLALKKVEGRADLYRSKQSIDYMSLVDIGKMIKPTWKKVMIQPILPPALADLQRLAKNLWWTWQFKARELFESVNKELWEQSSQNPMKMIELMSLDQINSLAKDHEFLVRLAGVMASFDDYMSKSSEKENKKVAYFSMEFGLDDILKTYSGGLGILAGDYLKEASDSNKNIIGVGLLYRYGYFTQSIALFGDQIVNYSPQKFAHLPLIPVRDENGEWIKISLALPGRNMYAKVWKVEVGRVPLYLLDTDIDENSDWDKPVTHQLYGGDWENRFKQEILLGVGGIRLLDAIGEHPGIYHCNEGHAAFTGIERLRKYVHEEKLTFYQALEVVRGSSLFTTHTPVPAGHDSFTEDILRTYIPHYPDRLGISWDTFMNLGRFTENKQDEKFSMSVLAAKLSQEINGVSKIHGRVSREMFAGLYDGYFPEELHISYVTNGVHLPTWTAREWRDLYDRTFGADYIHNQSDAARWINIQDVDDKEIWSIRNTLRTDLINYLKDRVSEDLRKRHENPKNILKSIENLDEKVLTIGFARRFATYKRAQLLFSNLDRLREILNNPERPVQLIYAGKAHPYDNAGQDLIKKVIEVSRRPEFLGKVVFVENYDMRLAKKLIQGVDIWLNTPTRPLEASGTSGEKAVMNGIINFSVLDGWWAEGYKPNAGWALKEERTYANQQFQDELDAETIYSILEEEIVPHFYQTNDDGIPEKWVQFIKNTISGIAPHFTMKRMLDDYYSKFYQKLFDRTETISENNFEVAKIMAAWKKKVFTGFESMEVLSLRVPDPTMRPLDLGEKFMVELIVDLNELSDTDIGVEVVFAQKENDVIKNILFCKEMNMVKAEQHIATFSCIVPTNKSGVYDYAFRIYPKHKYLPHRQDINLIKWV